MIDMAQADRTLRLRTTKGTAYDWTQLTIAAQDLKPGEKCVIRAGEVLRIDPQWSYKEWAGCFSWIGGRS